MRLPNGYGSVYKLSGHRRRPYVVKKTIDGRQRALGYFESYQEAFEFLVHINHCTPTHQVTFAAVYAAWSQRHFPDVSASSRSAYSISYRHLSPLHAMPFGSISYSDLQSAIDAVPAGYCTRKKCRVLLSQMYKHAIKKGKVLDFARQNPEQKLTTSGVFSSPASVENVSFGTNVQSNQGDGFVMEFGKDVAHENLSPMIAAYCWKRTV